MTTFLQFALLGLGPGAIYLLLAAGVMLIYKGSGVLNFAQGAMAVVGGYIYYDLTQNDGWPAVPAVLVGGVASAAIGVVAYALVMRKLTATSTLIKLATTLALFITIESAGVLVWGQTQAQPTSALPTTRFTLGQVSGTVDRPILLGIAVVAVIALWAGFRFTTVGLATRALAENRRGTAALGWSHDTLAAANWALAGFLGGVAGALIAPITGLQVANTSLLVIPALAVALIGRFTSLPVALAGAIALGVAQSEASNYLSSVQGLGDALPVLVIVVFLAVRGKTIPVRGDRNDRMPALGTGRIRGWAVLAVGGLGVALMLTTFSGGLLGATDTSLEYVVLMLSVVVLTGYAGQISLANVTFGGVAALIAARLVAHGWGFAPAALVALAAMIPCGIVFGLPALRTRGINLAVVTLALSTAVSEVIFDNGTYTGADGIVVGATHVFGLDVDSSTHPGRWTLLVVACLLATVLAVANVRRGRVGRRLVALRDNERAAMSIGVSVVEGKLYAFVLAGVIAGLGGILVGFQNQAIQFASPSVFDPFQNILIVAFTILGGVGFLIGPFYGGLIFVTGGTIPYLLSLAISPTVSEYVALVGGIGLLWMITIHPDGIFTLHARGATALGRAVTSRLLRRGPGQPVAPVEAEPQHVRAAPLAVSGLTVRFGGVLAVDDVSFTVAPGEVVGLIGPNGAGKTTVIDAISGFVKPSAGTILLGDTLLDGKPAYVRARQGLSRSFQSLELFEDLTVRDNLRVASEERDIAAYLINLVYSKAQPMSSAALAAIREFDLSRELDQRPGELSYGRRRLVAVARAVAPQPSILMLDEPAAGLDSVETAELARCVRRLAAAWGVGVVVIEHDMSFVMGLCDRVVVLNFGRKIADGSPATVGSDAAVIAAYLGEASSQGQERPLASPLTPEVLQ